MQIQAIQPIYTGGRVSAGIRQAKAGVRAADASLSAARQDLFLQVVTAHVDAGSHTHLGVLETVLYCL